MAAALLSSATSYFAAVARERLHPGTVEFWVPIAPAAIYWLVAAFFDVLDMLQLPATERYRLHSQALADKRNQLTKGQVVCRVLLQHAIQVLTGWALVFADPGYCDGVRAPPGGQGLLRAAGSWLAAMLVFDSWQYAIHRFMHENKTLYNAIHRCVVGGLTGYGCAPGCVHTRAGGARAQRALVASCQRSSRQPRFPTQSLST